MEAGKRTEFEIRNSNTISQDICGRYAAVMPVTNWMCLKCGVTNPKTYFKCQTCQQAKPIFWECAACKRKNPTASVRCGECKRKRPAIFANAINIKSNVKFNCESTRSARDLRLQSITSAFSAGGASAAAAATASSVSNPFAATAANSSTPGNTLSTIGGAQMSTLSQSTKSTMSTISQHVSSYDIFLKLNKPSRTVKSINYVDSEEKYAQYLANCQAKNCLFVDTAFPASYRSLYFQIPASINSINKSARVFWLRPKDMRAFECVHDARSPLLKQPWCVAAPDPVSSDIIQGVLGNCWLLSALAVLVEKPALLDRILVQKEVSRFGIYRLRLFRDGKLQSIIVDDQFPCNNRRLLLYSSAKRKQLFLPLIEKAMARMYGCYESLVSGQTTEGLSALTGYPCRSIRTQATIALGETAATSTNANPNEEAMLDSDYIWTLLLSYQTAGFLMGAGCGCDRESTITAEEYASRGLMMQHAYSIISVITVDGGGPRLLQLRNPWGRQVWNGDWSDASPAWTDELRQQLRPDKACEGIFWIEFTDFQRYFEKVDVCKLRDNWHEQRFEGYFPSSVADFRYMSMFEVTIEEASTELEFTLHQESRRALNLRKAPLLPICVAIFRLKDMQRNIAGDLVDFSGYKIREFVGCDAMADKGVYMVAIYAFNHWTQSTEAARTGHNLRPRFVLSLHSSRVVAVNCYCPAPSIAGDTLIEMAISKGRQRKHSEHVVSYCLTDNWSGLVVVCENRSPDHYADVAFDATESTNLYATRGNLLTQDTLPPMSRQLLNVLSHLDPATSYYLSYQVSYRVSNDFASNHNPEIGKNLAALHSPRPFKQIRE